MPGQQACLPPLWLQAVRAPLAAEASSPKSKPSLDPSRATSGLQPTWVHSPYLSLPSSSKVLSCFTNAAQGGTHVLRQRHKMHRFIFHIGSISSKHQLSI